MNTPIQAYPSLSKKMNSIVAPNQIKLNPDATTFIPAISLIAEPIPAPTKAELDYPFSFIIPSEDEYVMTSFILGEIVQGLPSEEPIDPGNFPHNIVEYYWVHEGMNDEEPWYCLAKLDNGAFIFYTASCDYTGFDCQGGMGLTIASSLEKLVAYEMTEQQRELCIKDKTAAKG